tara:strand:- start:7025 stop:7621 length:597 start_codon:yes stop_codon:yes gene_type:complete
MTVDQETVKKMKNADKLKRNATTKDQMVSALNKLNYIRKKAKGEISEENCSSDCCGKNTKVEDCTCPPDCPDCDCNVNELALKTDKKLPNLKVPAKGPKGTSKYSRMKKMTVKKEQVIEGRFSKDDEEGAEHIVMQLRKSVSMRGNKEVMFQDGKTKKIPFKDAQRALDKYNRSKPMDKIKLQKQYEKDYRSFSQAIK